MIGEMKFVFEMLSAVENRIGIDVRRVVIDEKSGVIKIEFTAIIPPGPNMSHKLEELRKILSEKVDSYGLVLTGNIVSVNGYILSGKEPT